MIMYVYTYRIERNWMLSMLMNTYVGTSRKWKCPSYLNSFHVKSQNAKLWCQSQRAKIINEISQSYKSLTFSFDEIVCLNPMISIVSYPSLFSCTTSRTCRESSWRRHACPRTSYRPSPWHPGVQPPCSPTTRIQSRRAVISDHWTFYSDMSVKRTFCLKTTLLFSFKELIWPTSNVFTLLYIF